MTAHATEMIATVDEACLTAGGVAYEKPSERLEHVLRPYVVWRLRKEIDAGGHGHAAKVARAIGFTPAQVSAVKDEKRGISDDFAHALAKYWSISVDELNRLADAHVAQRRAEDEQDMTPQARLFRMIQEEVASRTSVTKEQLERAFSLAAVGGKITRGDVRRAFDRTDEQKPIDAELEHEHAAKRGKRKRPR